MGNIGASWFYLALQQAVLVVLIVDLASEIVISDYPLHALAEASNTRVSRTAR